MESKRQEALPLWEALHTFIKKEAISFHVPGHKNGSIFPKQLAPYFSSILPLDLTELPGLDDLHAPEGAIAHAEALAQAWFGSQHSYFLVGGSTVGNLAMLLATCTAGDKVVVQRNSHKSILNGLELSGATPVFISPSYSSRLDRYTTPTVTQYKRALKQHPDAKAVIVTYPDYFGHTYDLKYLIEQAHQAHIPVLVDEAHGVHFSLKNDLTPSSALDLGADIVVQSAHKMAPAMTMTGYLHINSSLLDQRKVTDYLTLLQSSSPSYPLLASLDVARHFLATRTNQDIKVIEASIDRVRAILAQGKPWIVVALKKGIDDPLKITLRVKQGYSTVAVRRQFEEEGLYPEFATDKDILLIHGLAEFTEWERLESIVEKITRQLNFSKKHATIERKPINFPNDMSMLVYSYAEMNQKETYLCNWKDAVSKVAAEAIVPYPPGIPYLVKGERITHGHVETINYLIEQQTNFQQANIEQGVRVFKGE